MSRKIEITVSPDNTNALLADLKKIEGLINLQLQKGVSISPPGDVISLAVASKWMQETMRLLDQYDLGKEGGVSITTSEPDSLISGGHFHKVDRDWVEASWEEMENLISKGSNSNSLILILVVTSGILAAVGIGTNAIHLTIGGMLVAPAFMPLMRITLGLATSCPSVWKKGLADTALVYLVLIITAALTAVCMNAYGSDPLPGKEDYYHITQSLFKYWTTVTPNSILASAAAALAGAVLLATKRSAFTSGVMIGLALVPSAAIIGMALVEGDFTGAGNAAIRWLTDIVLILVISSVFFVVLKKARHKRNLPAW